MPIYHDSGVKNYQKEAWWAYCNAPGFRYNILNLGIYHGQEDPIQRAPHHGQLPLRGGHAGRGNQQAVPGGAPGKAHRGGQVHQQGSHAIFLNTRYEYPGAASRDILEFLEYARKNDGAAPFSGALVKKVIARSEAVRSDDGKGEQYMTLKRLLLDERKEGEAVGEARGEARGIVKGKIETLFGLVQDGLLSLAEAARRAGLSENEFLKAAHGDNDNNV